ncbi:MAG: ShlB/FhaC/HecB family hemolysin secretion/activation protein [Leptolyngbya sp. SIO1E4]|nr:ShlB/FhaC/HecB family hemolysin secretion/activation protein [Leptolyngbya sp. SIO1E4]
MVYSWRTYWISAWLALSTGSLASAAHATPLDAHPDSLSEPSTIDSLAEVTAVSEAATNRPQSTSAADLETAQAPAIAYLLPQTVPDKAFVRTPVAPEAATISITSSAVPLTADALADPWATKTSRVTLNVTLDGLPSAPDNDGGIYLAQQGVPPIDQAPPIDDLQRIPEAPEPEAEPLPTLPSPEELLGPEFPSPENELDVPFDEDTFTVGRFEVLGSTVFSDEELAEVTAPFTGRPLTFDEVLEVEAAITQLYIDEGYITSGAIVPLQTFQDGGVAEIQVIEGSLEDIQITGTRRLHPGYVSSRIGVGASAPLNIDRLLERLQLLQLDPLIDTISADLQAGTRPGLNLLVVSVDEANSFDISYRFDNNRSPAVGTARHQFRLTEGNLSGLGDRLSIGYTLTEGSDGVDLDYTLPLNPYNGTLRFVANFSGNNVVEEPFDVLEIGSDSDLFELTLRQPLLETPTQEFTLGLSASHQRSQTSVGLDDIGPFPLSEGADDEGRTRVSALRFFQEWTLRNSEQVIALRSQFSLGLDWLDATVNEAGPDSRFFAWQGQGQWARSLGPDSLLLVRGGVQFTPDSLLTLERFGLGGQATVRGYRQDQLLTDNGILAAAEVRLPIWREPENNILLRLAPFIDVGYGWNNGGDTPDPDMLLGIGTGLILDIDDGLTARFDWGIPLISVDADRDTLQERGLYFSLGLSFLTQ